MYAHTHTKNTQTQHTHTHTQQTHTHTQQPHTHTDAQTQALHTDTRTGGSLGTGIWDIGIEWLVLGGKVGISKDVS